MSRPDSELAHLFRQLKAPAAARALPKLADRARQTVLQKVQRGELRAVQVTNGRRKGLRIEVPPTSVDRLINE